MLTQTSEYALRAMVYMARKGEGKYAGVKEIAKATEVPSNYLAKILQQLAKAGVLESQKGFGGGFRGGGTCLGKRRGSHERSFEIHVPEQTQNRDRLVPRFRHSRAGRRRALLFFDGWRRPQGSAARPSCREQTSR